MLRPLVFAAVGLAMEIVFTGCFAWLYVKPRDKNLWGRTTLWMIPVYAAAGWIFPVLVVLFQSTPVLFRLLFYVNGIWLAEILSGMALRKLLGDAPWSASYRTARWQVLGLIRLDFAPYWALAGWLFEQLALALQSLS